MYQDPIFSLKNVKAVIVIMVLMIVISGVVSAFTLASYQGTSKLLVVYSSDTADPFTASRNAAYITGLLSEVAYSTHFIDQVVQSDQRVRDDFGANPEARLRTWKNTIAVRTFEDRGIISIAVTHRDRAQADALVHAITDVLATKHQEYHGAAGITIKAIDAPSVGNRWELQDITRNLILGAGVGLIMGLTFIIIFPGQRITEFLFDFRNFRREETIDLTSLPLSSAMDSVGDIMRSPAYDPTTSRRV